MNLKALDPQRPHRFVHDRHHFEVRRCGVDPDHVEVDLNELPVPAPLGVLPSPDLGHVVALEGQVQLLGMGGHEAGEGHGEVEAQRHIPPAVIEKAVDLLVRLPAAFAEENLGVFEGRRVDRDEAGPAEDPGQCGLDFLLEQLGAGKGIPEPPQCLGLDDLSHGAGSRYRSNPGAVKLDPAWAASAAPDRDLDGTPAITTIGDAADSRAAYNLTRIG